MRCVLKPDSLFHVAPVDLSVGMNFKDTGAKAVSAFALHLGDIS